MKTPWELLKESKTKIKTTWRIAFVSALVLGLWIHLPVMLSDIPNHDGLSSMYFDQNMITSGRWFLTVACGFSSYFTIPWVIGLIGLIWLALTAAVLTKKGVCTVEGVTRRGERTLVIWRDCDTVDNDALNDFFRRMSYSTRDTEFDRIYVNGDNNLENLRTDEEQWKVVLTEQEFAKRMFEDC